MRISDWSSDVCSSDLHSHCDKLVTGNSDPQQRAVGEYRWRGCLFRIPQQPVPRPGRAANGDPAPVPPAAGRTCSAPEGTAIAGGLKATQGPRGTHWARVIAVSQPQCQRLTRPRYPDPTAPRQGSGPGPATTPVRANTN